MKPTGLAVATALLLGLASPSAQALCGRSCICTAANNYCQGGSSGGGLGGGGGYVDPTPTPIDHARAAYNEGNRLLDAGDNRGAEAAYRQALAANPNHALALNNLGVALDRQGRVNEALDSYGRAAQLGVPEASQNYQRTRAWLDAEAARQAREKDEREKTAKKQVDTGVELLRQGQYDAARQWFAAALKWNPNNPDARAAEGYIQALEAKEREADGQRAQRETEAAQERRGQQGSPKWVADTLNSVAKQLESRLESRPSAAWGQAQAALRRNGRAAGIDLSSHYEDWGNRDGMAADLAGDFFDKGVYGKSPLVVGDRTPLPGQEIRVAKPPPKKENIPDPKESKPIEKPAAEKAGGGKLSDADSYRALEAENARLEAARQAAEAKALRERDEAKREAATREAENAAQQLAEKRAEMVSYPVRRGRFSEPPPPTILR